MRISLFILAILVGAGFASSAEPDWRQGWEQETRQRWFAKGLEQLKTEAGHGDAVAMWFLALKLRDQGDHDEALKWRDKAAAAGLPQAIAWQAESLEDDDLGQAMERLERAGATGYPWAKFKLALLLRLGAEDKKHFRVQPDPGRAVKLLQEAADNHMVQAWAHLAQLYACGIGEPRNEKETPAELFRLAAVNGDVDALMEMANRARIGFGVEQDYLAAAIWATRANRINASRLREGAAPGPADWLRWETGDEVELLRHLSNLFFDGLARGSAPALMEMAAMHVEGKHGQPNLPRAAALFAMAEGRGDSSAGAKRREIESKLDEKSREDMKKNLAWMRQR